jgi:hypothetical protein
MATRVQGISFCRQTKMWKAYVVRNDKQIWLGRHPTKEEALRVYTEYVKTLPAVDRHEIMKNSWQKRKMLRTQEEIDDMALRRLERLQSGQSRYYQKARLDPSYRPKRNAKRELRRTQNRARLWEYLLEHPCACGESDPVVLEFDHNDGDGVKEKKYIVSALVGGGYSWETVMKEIAKCTVRCSNCHQRRTAKQLGFWRGFST